MKRGVCEHPEKEFRAIHNAVIQAAQSLPDAQYALGKLLLPDDVEVHDREQAIRGRHGAQTGQCPLGRPHRSGHKENGDSIFRYLYADTLKELTAKLRQNIDIYQGIGKADPQTETGTTPQKPAPSTFQPHKGQRRKTDTGCVTRINESLWERRYSPVWPDGKKHARSVYAHSKEECEKLLAEMIAEMKAKITAEKERLKATPKAS